MSTYPTIPEDMVVIIDTREQKPLFVKTPGLVKVISTLHDGDYSIKGFEDKFSIERKQVSDFFSYIGKEREKTIKKLERLQCFDFAALVVESDLEDLLAPQIYTKLSANHVWGFTASINIKYGIHFFFNKNRNIIERYCLDRMIKYWGIKRGI